MKKFVAKMQGLGQKAAQFKHVVESAPARAAELRESLLMTANQLQQIRSDVQMSAAGLKVDTADRLTQALREIHDHADTFRQAGYDLMAVDMEISPIQRLVVHLEKVEDVPESTLRGLLSANSGRQTIYALLTAMAKADALTSNVILSHLTYRELVVHVGPTPSVRISWHAENELGQDEVGYGSETPPASLAAPPLPAFSAGTSPSTPPPLSGSPTAPTSAPPSAFTQSTYFEPRPAAAARVVPTAETPSALSSGVGSSPSATAPVTVVPGATEGAAAAPVEPAAGGDWRRSALDRFKKMPDVSKYRR